MKYLILVILLGYIFHLKLQNYKKDVIIVNLSSTSEMTIRLSKSVSAKCVIRRRFDQKFAMCQKNKAIVLANYRSCIESKRFNQIARN